MPLPLEGIRVLDSGDVWAGPFGCTLLADWGAEVIRIESIQRFSARGQLNPPPVKPPGTPLAAWGYPDNIPGERPWNRSTTFNNLNRNKLGITLDLHSEDGLRLFKELVKRSDIVIENFAQGVMERLGLGYSVLREVNPGIIVISMPLFGNSGPYKHFRGYGNTAEPLSGHVSLRGYPDQNVEKIQGTVHTDAVSAATVVFAALAALRHRRRTGAGQFIDFGQIEAFLPHLGEVFLDYQMNGRTAGRQGNRDARMAPHGCYPCLPDPDGQPGRNDRWVTIACRNEDDWGKLRAVMGDPEWAHDPRFATMADRKANEDALDRFIAQWTCRQEPEAVFRQVAGAGVPAGIVLDHAQIQRDPQVLHWGFFEQVTHPEAGTHLYPGMLWSMSESRASIRRPANTLGEHNTEVLGGLLGLSEAELERLAETQVIGTAFLPGADE